MAFGFIKKRKKLCVGLIIVFAVVFIGMLASVSVKEERAPYTPPTSTPTAPAVTTAAVTTPPATTVPIVATTAAPTIGGNPKEVLEKVLDAMKRENPSATYTILHDGTSVPVNDNRCYGTAMLYGNIDRYSGVVDLTSSYPASAASTICSGCSDTKILSVTVVWKTYQVKTTTFYMGNYDGEWKVLCEYIY